MSHAPVPAVPLDHLPHPTRLRALSPTFLEDIRKMLGPEWVRLQALLKDERLVLPEVIRRLAQPGVAPRFAHLVQLSTAMPGGTDQGGPLGMVAWLRHEAAPAPHFLIDDELVQMLERTDIAPDVPLSMFNLPFNRLYVEFGRKRQLETTIPNALSGDHILEGAYVERGQHVEGEILYIVLTGSPLGKSGPQDDATLSMALPLFQAERPIAEVIRAGHERAIRESREFGLTESPEDWTDDTIRAVLLLVKALLYIGLPGTRREMHPERTEALKGISGLKSPGKKAKAMHRIDRVYDYIRVGPQPEHVAPAEGSSSTTDRSVRTHWRRGHYRMQAHGTQMSLRKLIFLQPMLVAATGPTSDAPAVPDYKVV